MKNLILVLFTVFSTGMIYLQGSIGLEKNENEKVPAMLPSQFTSMVDSLAAEYGITGVVTSLFSANEVLNIHATGVKVAGGKDEMEVQSKMHLGSNSKAMTGFVAGAMVEEGLISWDTRFLAMFPEMGGNEAYEDITLQDLLSHQAGIQPFTEEDEFEEMSKFMKGNDVVQQRKEWSAYLLCQPPQNSEEGFVYSNAGYTMAALMLETSAHMGWEDLIRKYIFSPLEMDGGFSWPNVADPSQPWGHYQDSAEDSVTVCAPSDEYVLGELVAPAGDIHVSIPDYVKYLQINLRGISGQDDLLRAETVRFLHGANIGESIYQIGWGVLTKKMDGRELTFSSHDGSGGTYYATTLLVHELGMGIVVASNIAGPQQEVGIRKIRNNIIHHLVEASKKADLAGIGQ